MNLKNVCLFIISIVFLTFFVSSYSLASEGRIELRSTTGDPYRCLANSVFLDNNRYEILVSCRDLIYPIDNELLAYVMWATPSDGDDPEKLGELGTGKANFDTRDQFSNLFVTTETDPRRTRTPSGRVVMQGSVQPEAFLGQPFSPTSTPAEEEQVDEEEQVEEEEQGETEELSTRDKLVLGLKRAGIVAFFALIAIIGLIFVITRSRG